jgi:hypothetical protein
VRKPAPFKLDGTCVAVTRPPNEGFIYPIHVSDSRYTPAEARRLAAWLNKAAAWVEAQKRKK